MSKYTAIPDEYKNDISNLKLDSSLALLVAMSMPLKKQKNEKDTEFVKRIVRAYVELCAPLARATQTYVDEKGETWLPPTAYAYAQVCKANNKSKKEAELWKTRAENLGFF